MTRARTTSALLIPVDEPPRLVQIEPSLEGLQGLVGGWIEALQLTPEAHAYINEEGKLIPLTPNRFATALCAHLDVGLMAGDWIAGPMVCLSMADDGDEADVGAAFVEQALGLWDERCGTEQAARR